MIKVEKLDKKYNNEFILKNINFEVRKGQTLVIIGPSGSGKTTLLRCINKLEDLTSGHIYLDGAKITNKNRKILSLKIGLVFQHCYLFPHMTVMENLIYSPCKVLNQNLVEASVKGMNLLEKFKIKSKAEHLPSSLSGGQKQRVAICRALMMDPDIIFFDEPTSALDPEVIKDVVEVIEDLKSSMTIIVVTHHLKFAKAIADRIIFMDQGQVLCDQKSEDFFSNPESQRAKLFLANIGDLL